MMSNDDSTCSKQQPPPPSSSKSGVAMATLPPVTVGWSHTPPTPIPKFVALLFPSSRLLYQVFTRKGGDTTLPSHRMKRVRTESGAKRDRWTIIEREVGLNPDLVGVKAALSVLENYERSVGIQSLVERSQMEDGRSGVLLSARKADEDEDVVKVHQEKWKELMTELMKPLEESEDVASSGGDDSDSYDDDDTEGSMLSSLHLSDWDRHISLPSTPMPKALSLDGDIPAEVSRVTRSCTSSPLGGSPGHQHSEADLSQLKRLATPPLSFSTDSSPKSSATSPSPPLSEFVFPSLSTTYPPKIHLEKDDQGFFTGFEDQGLLSKPSPSSSLLPPFLMEDSQKRKPSQSRTRTLVDRLKSDTQRQEESQGGVSSKPNAGRGTPSPEDVKKPVARTEGWVIANDQPYQPDQSRAERKRDLFLALSKHHHDRSRSSDSSSKKTTSPAHSHDGWIDPKQTLPKQQQQQQQQQHHQHTRSKSQNKRSGMGVPPQTAPPTYTTFRPPPLPAAPLVAPPASGPTSVPFYYAPYPYGAYTAPPPPPPTQPVYAPAQYPMASYTIPMQPQPQPQQHARTHNRQNLVSVQAPMQMFRPAPIPQPTVVNVAPKHHPYYAAVPLPRPPIPHMHHQQHHHPIPAGW